MKQPTYRWVSETHTELEGEGKTADFEFFKQATADFDILSSEGRERYMKDHKAGVDGPFRAHLTRLEDILNPELEVSITEEDWKISRNRDGLILLAKVVAHNPTTRRQEIDGQEMTSSGGVARDEAHSEIRREVRELQDSRTSRPARYVEPNAGPIWWQIHAFPSTATGSRPDYSIRVRTVSARWYTAQKKLGGR